MLLKHSKWKRWLLVLLSIHPIWWRNLFLEKSFTFVKRRLAYCWNGQDNYIIIDSWDLDPILPAVYYNHIYVSWFYSINLDGINEPFIKLHRFNTLASNYVVSVGCKWHHAVWDLIPRRLVFWERKLKPLLEVARLKKLCVFEWQKLVCQVCGCGVLSSA